MHQRWIFTRNMFSDRWGGLNTVGIRSAGGIKASEWFNVETGAGFLLMPDGKWNEGGRWHLFYIPPGGHTAANVDTWLAPIDTAYPRDPVGWCRAEGRCIAFVEHLIGASRDLADIAAELAVEHAEVSESSDDYDDGLS